MKIRLFFLSLVLLATGGSLFAQQDEGTPVKGKFGSGPPNANIAHVIGTQYVDTSTGNVWFCTAVTLTSTTSSCTWTQANSSGGAPTGAAGGDLGATYPNPTVTGLGGNVLPNITASNGFFKDTGGTLSIGTLVSTDIPNNSATAGNISGIAAVPNGGSGAATFTIHALLAGEGAAAFNPICGSGLTGQLFQANNGADPTCISPGVSVRTASANDTILCDSATAIRDRGNLVVYTASLTATIPDPSASGCGGGFFVTVIDQTGTTTVNRTTTATFTVCQGFSTTCTAALTTFNLLVGQRATFVSDNTNWYAYITGGIPVVAGCTASANHVLCYDPTNGNTHIRINGADAIALGETAAQAAGFLLKQNDATDGRVVATLCDEGITTANVLTCTDSAGLQVTQQVKIGTAPACTAGTGGGVCATEGTVLTGVANADGWSANSSLHCLDINNNNAEMGCAVAESAIIAANVVPKAVGTTPQVAASSITDDGQTVTTTEPLRGSNTVFVTSNFTTASTSLVTITGLTWTLGATAHNYHFVCTLSYSQATAAAANAFGVQATTTAPTNLYAAMEVATNLTTATAWVSATLPTLTTTTATNIGTFTPGAFGSIGTVADIFTAKIWGELEQGAGATTLNIMALTGNASDSLTIYRGSSCTLMP